MRLLDHLEKHDPYTAGHSRRVGAYSTVLGRLLGFDRPALDLLRRAAFAHDVGKAAIPVEVLGKTGALTDAEFDLIKRHPVAGTIMLEERGLGSLVPMVLHHHERWDGMGGYPTGLAGVDIPLESRIILVADAYDAMTTNRPYGRVCSPEQAVAEIKRCAGSQFDPMIAAAMVFAFEGGLLKGGSISALEEGATVEEVMGTERFMAIRSAGHVGASVRT